MYYAGCGQRKKYSYVVVKDQEILLVRLNYTTRIRKIGKIVLTLPMGGHRGVKSLELTKNRFFFHNSVVPNDGGNVNSKDLASSTFPAGNFSSIFFYSVLSFP